jgi:hypothetical protein
MPEEREFVKSCGGGARRNKIGEMSETAQVELPLRVQDEVECRHCEVHCEKVVHPGACLRMECPFVYSYQAWGRTYMGCLQKVFDVEIDLELLERAESRRGGFGAVRARRTPLPMCETEVVPCYPGRGDELGCRNPEFYELPRERTSFRIFARVAD